MCGLVELKVNMCRFTDDGKEFCGKDIFKVSYCREHYNKCYMDKKEAKEYKRILENMTWKHWGNEHGEI